MWKTDQGGKGPRIMECQRFVNLLKQWYVQVQAEEMAPARMVAFMEKHVTECEVCMMDPEARRDMDKIIKLVLPQDKLKVPARTKKTGMDEDLEEDAGEDVGEEEGEETSDESDEDKDDLLEDDEDALGGDEDGMEEEEDEDL